MAIIFILKSHFKVEKLKLSSVDCVQSRRPTR